MTDRQLRTLHYAYLDLLSLVTHADDGPFVISEIIEAAVKTVELMQRDFEAELSEVMGD